MTSRNLDLDLLRTFAAVADTGSFTAAAGLVSRTQSAVSMQVQRLESALGRRVFERGPRALALTPAGRVLMEHARRMLELNDEALRRFAGPPVEGRVRLGVTEYFVPNELARILARFAAAHPGVELEVRMGLSRELRADLEAGRLDAAVVRLDAALAKRVAPIWSEPQHWVAAEGWEHRRGEAVPLVALPAPCVLRHFAIETLQRARRPWRLAYEGSSMASVQAAVIAGLGVSIVSRSSLVAGMRALPRGRAWPDPGPLEIGVLEGRAPRREIVQALETVAREALGVLAVARARLAA